MHELAGHSLVLREGEMQLSRGESPRDTALVLSRMVHAIAIRTGDHAPVEELARYSSVPVINMLTADHHPCQALADLMTMKERFGDLHGLKLVYVGDGNNVAHSLMVLGAKAGLEVVVATPAELAPHPLVAQVAGAAASNGGSVAMTTDPAEASEGAHAIYTDVWVSMGDDPATADSRRELLAPYRLDEALMAAGARRRRRAPLPARPPGRGDHRGRPLRRPVGDLGPGREPPARPEGATRAAARALTPTPPPPGGRRPRTPRRPTTTVGTP